MSSVLVQDFYRAWRERRGDAAEQHYVQAGRVGMGVIGVAMFAMAVVSYYWQRYSSMGLLEFALQVMVFTYAGLLGVYFTALFTGRGTTGSVIAALIVGFVTVLLLQPGIASAIGLPGVLHSLSFPFQLCIATPVAFLVCVAPAGSGRKIVGNRMKTEALDPRYRDLDRWRTELAIDAMLEGQMAEIAAIQSQTGAIAHAAEAAAARLGDVGRLVFVGAGTSGRLAVQDGAELHPTFGWPMDRLVFMMAGGSSALTEAYEGAEDDA
eukprot:gene36354-43260_t